MKNVRCLFVFKKKRQNAKNQTNERIFWGEVCKHTHHTHSTLISVAKYQESKERKEKSDFGTQERKVKNWARIKAALLVTL